MDSIMFPVFLKEEGKEPPDKNTFFVVAKNGLFLRKRNGWVDAMVPVKQIDVLEEQAISAKILLPSLSSIVMAKTVAFFRKIKEQSRTEALTLLHYNPDKGWEMSVPKQTVGSASVDYDRSERLPDYNCMGTIHSHPGFGAFHSSTDKGDEEDWDGVHITIGGDIDDNGFTIDAEVVINGCRFSLPMSWLEGVAEVEKKPGLSVSYFLSSFYGQKKHYSVSCPELNGWQVPDEWLKRVEKKAYVFSTPLSSPGDCLQILDKSTSPSQQDRFAPLENRQVTKPKPVGNTRARANREPKSLSEDGGVPDVYRKVQRRRTSVVKISDKAKPPEKKGVKPCE